MTPRSARLFAIWFALLALDVAIQVMMKLAGDRLAGIPFGVDWIVAALSSALVWASLIGYFATFVLWLAILHASPLSAAFPVTALVYVLVPLCGWVLLGERMSAAQAGGIALILAGVILQHDTAPQRTSRS
jgi:drug/metabolite transporter (DMT)-like permease